MLYTSQASLSVFPQVRLQYNISQADAGAVARHHERDWWHVWHQRPLLFPVPQVAAHVQHFLFPCQLWLYHHPAARLRPLTQHTSECELQRTGDTDWSCKWRLLSHHIALPSWKATNIQIIPDTCIYSFFLIITTFKAALITIFILKMEKITVYNVKGVTHDKPTKQLCSSPQLHRAF